MAKKKSKAKDDRRVELHDQEIVEVASLKPHPKNYRSHGPEQLQHLVESLKANGVYRNVVVASDYTILAGHGVVEACKKVGLERIPVVRLDIPPDHPTALKVLAGDNEIARGAVVDDRGLTDLLREIAGDPVGLLGTGFSDLDLERLLALGQAVDPRAEWAGMPEFGMVDKRAHRQIIISFRNDRDVQKFAKLVGQSITDKTRALWYPRAKIDKVADLRYVEKKK